MGDSTEISDAELDAIEHRIATERATDASGLNDFGIVADAARLVAAFRSTRERLAAAEMVIFDAWESGSCPGCGEEADTDDEHNEVCSWVDWRALAHPTTEEPTDVP